MKHQTRWITLVFVLFTLLAGCATSGGGEQLRQTRVQVDWAMTRYHNRQTFGFLTANEEQQVATAYTTYQTAFNQAVREAGSNLDAPTPPNVLQLANQLLALLDAIP